jgi:hypothetical protein
VYVLARRPDGTFAAPEKLLDKAGNVLRLGQYWDDAKSAWAGVETSKFKESLGIGVAPCDWDADGDVDLVLGANAGQLFLRRNAGTREKPAFEVESEPVTAGGAPIRVPGDHAIPFVADWDADGLFDILSGGGSGGVVWYRNVGKKGAPEFAAVAELVAMKKDVGTLDAPTWPGTRTQVCAADFDGDGDLDLLVGDYNSGPWRQAEGQPAMHGWVWLFRRR